MKKNIALLISIAFVAATIFFILASKTKDKVDPNDQAVEFHQPDKQAAIWGDNENPTNEPLPEVVSTDEAAAHRDIASFHIRESTNIVGPLNAWLEKMKQSDIRYQTSKDGSTVYTILGGNFPNIGNNENTAYDFLSQFAEKIGVDSSQLDKKSLFTQKTVRKQVYGFEQVFGGMPVFNSYVKVETKREDNSAYMIHNNLKVIPSSTVIPKVSVDVEQAKRNALNTINKKFQSASETDKPLVVFAEKGKTIDVAWSLLLTGDHVSEFVLVSATTGEVLANYSAQSHQAN